MLMKPLPIFLVTATALGALSPLLMASAKADCADQAFESASPVQVVGTAPSNRMPGQAGSPVQLLNDADSGGEVWFLIDGQERSLQPGETMDLSGDRPHLVEFNTGGDFGDVKFTLYQGLYKFKVMPEGWALFKSTSSGSVTGRTPATRAPSQVQRSSTPPQPAQDLRTRRTAGRSEASGENATSRPVNPPQPPAATTGAGQDTTRSIAAPPPAGVTRDRTAAPRTP